MEYFDQNDPEIQCRIITQNEFSFAFPTNTPIVPGHILICPKRKVKKIDELTSEELLAIFDLLKILKPAMKKTFGAKGLNYAWNEEKVAEQSVLHLHLHMIPRKEGDTGIWEYEPRKFLYRPNEAKDRLISPEQELIDIAKLLIANI